MSSLPALLPSRWEYRDIAPPPLPKLPAVAEVLAAPAGLSEADVAARTEAAVDLMRKELEAEREAERQEGARQLQSALEQFQKQRAGYFRRVEAEVVQLSLGVARKILQREASLDPTLLSGLVRIALDRMGAEAPIRVRLAPAMLERWKDPVAAHDGRVLEAVADPGLSAGDCLVETSLGSANFGFEAQLREIEASFEQVLALRAEFA